MKRVLIALAALSMLAAAAPVNRIEVISDPRIPLENQQLLEHELEAALQQNGLHGTVTISLRVIEPQPQRTTLLAAK